MNTRSGKRIFLVFFCALHPLFSTAPLLAHELTAQVAAKPAIPSTGSLKALVIFAKFQGEAPGYEQPPTWSAGLFDAGLPGSVAHFYRDMSGGKLELSGEVLPRVYSSRQPASAYLAETPGQQGKFGQFNLEILEQVDRDVDLGRFDSTGDGYVDMVFINLLTVPRDFFIGTATGFASLGLDSDYLSDDPAPGGGQIRIRGRFNGIGGTTQRGHTFTIAAATICHELGHVLGLPDLFDQTFLYAGADLRPEMDSAGIGKWGLMGLGTLGWGVEDGPNAFSAWSLARLGWVEVVELRQSVRELVIEDIIQSRRVFKIPLTRDEYFLLENRQASGSHYNRNVPSSGLLIWHVDERTGNNDEARHKWVDLVSADGQFADRGFPGERPDPIAGGDNLDFWSRDAAYAAAHHGNQGDATDPFDGVRFTRFAHDTNPRLSAYTGFTRRLPPGIALENIRAQGGRMILDVEMHQPLDGHLHEDTRWSGIVEVIGDVVVQPGVTLTIAPGTEVRFPSFDWRQSGFDPQLCELLVFGELDLQGTAEAPVRFTSTQLRGRWGGIFLLDGQTPALEHAIVEKSVHGVVNLRLPPGITRWSGVQRLSFDLVIPADAELVVTPGTVVQFGADLGRQGLNPELTELIVEGKLTVEGETGLPVRFTGVPSSATGLWYGVRLKPGAQVDIRGLQLDRAVLGFSGEVSPESRLRIADSRLGEGAAGGLRLLLNGQAEILRTVFTRNPGQAIRVEGRGRLVLREVRVVDNGQEGIFLGNAGLHLEDGVVERNGLLRPEDPRSGIKAVGGRGQQLRLERTRLADNRSHGLELDDWEGVVELHDSVVRHNQRDGLRAANLERLALTGVTVEQNRERGAAITGSPVEIGSSRFVDNQEAGLLLTGGVSGRVFSSEFCGAPGLEIEASDSLRVRFNQFAEGALGLLCRSAAPQLEGNRFIGNETALQVRGSRLPEVVRHNSFTANGLAVDNRSPLTLPAPANYWGTIDSVEIAALIAGPVTWLPFLEQEPDVTAVTQSTATPVQFALGPGYPNPFNHRVIVPFAVTGRSNVTLVVYDALGRPVRRLAAAVLEPGAYQATWDGRNAQGAEAASGVYFIRLQTSDQVAVTRLALVR